MKIARDTLIEKGHVKTMEWMEIGVTGLQTTVHGGCSENSSSQGEERETSNHPLQSVP